jgi:hypothetical protein
VTYLKLLFGTGANASNSPCSILGFYREDKVGGIILSDDIVKDRNAATPLLYTTHTAETGHNLTSALATLTSTTFSTMIVWTDGGGGTRNEISIDITTSPNNVVSGLMASINEYVEYTAVYAGTSASLISRVAKKYSLAPNDTLIVNANNGTDQTFTFPMTYGTSVSGVEPRTKITSGVNDRIVVSINGLATHELVLGTQENADKIAIKIQELVRGLRDANPENQVAYSNFQCIFDGRRYILVSGTAGTGSRVVVTNAVTNNGAAVLKLGTANGGIETVGSGFCANNAFVTISEISNFIGTYPAVGFVIGGANYLTLVSNAASGARLEIKTNSTALIKLGFDNNNLADPIGFDSLPSTVFKPFASSQIRSQAYCMIQKGWDASSNIEIAFYSADVSQLAGRQSVVASRIPLIPGRLVEIPNRVDEIEDSVTSAMYQQRRAAVQFRLNRRSGSYAKIGKKLSEQDQNNQTIAANEGTITEIEGLLS